MCTVSINCFRLQQSQEAIDEGEEDNAEGKPPSMFILTAHVTLSRSVV